LRFSHSKQKEEIEDDVEANFSGGGSFSHRKEANVTDLLIIDDFRTSALGPKS
jgi:hypothetical protein